MKRYSKELIIGFSVLVAGLVLFAGINYLKGINVFKAANYYYATYTNVAGLNVSSPITLNGYKVGEVRSVDYMYDNPGHVVVELSLARQLRVPEGSKAVIVGSLLGEASIELHLTDATSYYSLGAEIPGEVQPTMLDAVSGTFSTVMPKVDSLLTSVNRLVSDSALLASSKRLDGIIPNLATTTEYLKRTMATMPGTMRTVDGVAHNLDSITDNLAVLSQQLKELPLRQTVDNVNSITANVNDVTKKMNTPDNNVGLMLNDRELYDNINNITLGIDSIVLELKKNPKKYIPSIKIF